MILLALALSCRELLEADWGARFLFLLAFSLSWETVRNRETDRYRGVMCRQFVPD